MVFHFRFRISSSWRCFLKLRSSGVVCITDEEGHIAECDEENSQLPDDLKTNGAVPTDQFICVDVTYRTGFILKQTHHVLQCAYELKGQRLCSVLKNSNDVAKCIESAPGFLLKKTHHVLQCAYELKGQRLCSVLKNSNDVAKCVESTPASGLYCIVDDVDDTVQCDRSNSVLPNDVNAGKFSKTSEYVCLDLTYKVGIFLLQQTKHVRQCALEVNSEDGLCDVLENNNDVASCAQSTPYTTPTVEPPSNLYCEVDSDGDKIECSKANSVLPRDLNIGGAQKSSSFVCFSATYKTGIFPFENTHSTQQCAYELSGDKDLCAVLRNKNNVQKCREWEPSKGDKKTPLKHKN
ncbi:hypothetical protein WA026_001520 [Henosepilachna vigintioctopunctata]|uniref:Uncharacterized protein n=1 Tax=Henosepilachna vigintioctopunctata TaxID=420089 RepID=A0AAW1ULG2_9CUCU